MTALRLWYPAVSVTSYVEGLIAAEHARKLAKGKMGYAPSVRRTSLGLLLGLLPFIVGAAPDAGQDAGPSATVPSACTGLPPGAQLIHGLVSGQVLTSGNTVTLQFSNVAFSCGSWLSEITSEGCHDDWAFSLTVPASALVPGVHNLAAISAQFGELYGVAGPPSSGGCSNEPCTMNAKGIGSVGVTDPGATLEIDSADAQCITGAITGLTDVFADAPDHDGAFVALPCAQQNKPSGISLAVSFPWAAGAPPWVSSSLVAGIPRTLLKT